MVKERERERERERAPVSNLVDAKWITENCNNCKLFIFILIVNNNNCKFIIILIVNCNNCKLLIVICTENLLLLRIAFKSYSMS